MARPALIIRCVIASLAVAPIALLPLIAWLVGIYQIDPGDRCNFGQCWGRGKWDPWFFLIFLFPPAWAGAIILHLRTSRNLSWPQYLWSSLISLFCLQIFNLVWTGFLMVFSLQQIVVVGLFHPLTLLMIGVTLQGYVILWFANYEALRFLPRPLGVAGRDEWDKPVTA
ncbi:hypothetical protein [Maricaulis parjimensis]|uniref:hypothetical protein n=1 Tax=Maricaulis parjimensis TaxID=144023 RepID=UPI001939D6E8|nr:hypothetical protein [Maricaulis parjimensis]